MSIPTNGWKLIGIKSSGGTTISTYIHQTTPQLIRLSDWSGNQYYNNGKLVG